MKSTGLFLSIVSLISMGCCAMQTQFFVRDQVGNHEVKRYDISPFLRSLSPKQLQKYGEVGNKIRAIKLSNGDYRVQEQGELKGSGPIWACVTAIAGYTAVGVASLGTLIVTAPSGPGCVAAAAGVAISGTIAVTKAVIVVAASPTP